jgi:transposase-like protein
MSSMRIGSAAAKWRQRIAEQARCGQSITAFCERHGLANSSFHYWKRRLRDESAASLSSADRFVQLAVAPAAVVIERPDGLILRVPCEERALRTVLAALVPPTC